MIRLFTCLGAVICFLITGLDPVAADTEAFKKEIWQQASQKGISRQVFDRSLQDFQPDPKVIRHTQKQSEFVRPVWSYLDDALAQSRLQRGRRLAAEWHKTLVSIEKRYGIPRSAVLGIWGMESNFGSYTGKIPTINALATLAYKRYRGDFFTSQLIEALLMVEKDRLEPAMMVGSWAGAMGQVQFMPSSYRKYAVDYDKDGIKNIWSSIPDALASAANYLKQHQWNSQLPWGFEVFTPEGFDFRYEQLSFQDWYKHGIRKMDGREMPKKGMARIFAPAGRSGPVFLLTENFDVIKEYNSSDSYALAVLLLGDALTGQIPVATEWPRTERQLDHKERMELQKKLQILRLYQDKIDGRYGSKTRAAVRQFQLQKGLVADGYPSYAILEALRKVKN